MQSLHTNCMVPYIATCMQSLQAELSGLQGEVEAGRERVRELEVVLADKEEKVRIVERKSNGMVRHAVAVSAVYALCLSVLSIFEY